MSDQSGDEGQCGGDDRGKGRASSNIAGHGQSRWRGVASVFYDFGIVGMDIDDVTSPLVSGSEELDVVCFISHILFGSCTRILICVSLFFVATLEEEKSLTPPRGLGVLAWIEESFGGVSKGRPGGRGFVFTGPRASW